MSCESPVILQGVRGELINAGLAQRVGEGESAWVGGPGRTSGCAQCWGLVIWRPSLEALAGGGGAERVTCRGLRGGCWRAPRTLLLVPGKF